MEVKISEALPPERVIRPVRPASEGAAAPNFTVVPNRAGRIDAPQRFEPARSAPGAAKTKESRQEQQDQEALHKFGLEETEEVTEKAAELLSMFDRELKYEMKTEAGVVQMQVINSSDGEVVRKIPADYMIKLIEHIKSRIDAPQTDDGVDVWA